MYLQTFSLVIRYIYDSSTTDWHNIIAYLDSLQIIVWVLVLAIA